MVVRVVQDNKKGPTMTRQEGFDVQDIQDLLIRTGLKRNVRLFLIMGDGRLAPFGDWEWRPEEELHVRVEVGSLLSNVVMVYASLVGERLTPWTGPLPKYS
jgi:hypothetical protein